ncbi:MAG: glutaredoxin family protein, partial [Solirubrobacterales bacterium]
MHGQRGDDRLGRPVSGADPLSRVPGVGRAGVAPPTLAAVAAPRLSAGSPVVTLYGRDGCHLCDEARRSIVALDAELGGIELREVDIEADDRLLAAYLERIPVVELDG